MDWKLFVARRIYRSKEGEKEVSKPAILIATWGIAIGLAVMIVAVAVVVGFKHEVRDKVVGLGSDITITHFDALKSYETIPVMMGDSLMNDLQATEGVKHVQRYSTKPGMIMTDDNFLGMVLKGVAQEYDWTFLRKHLLEGEIPVFSDSASANRTLISRTIANKLNIHTGDKLYTYYIEGENVRARRLEVAGIYQTNFSLFDDLFLLTDLHTVNRLNNWKGDRVTGVELEVVDYDRLEDVKENIREKVDLQVNRYGNTYYTQTVEENNPQIFAWLDLLDMNVWVILILMTGVAGFTMISGLLIIILERTNMIGILKAVGADNLAIRKIFLSFSVFLIGRGMLWGNLIGLAFVVIQSQFRLFKLDPATYYVDSVPVEFNVWWWVLLNVCTMLVSVLMLVGPSYLITRIHPAKSIRFE
ncbi:MAG: ABC transporter permease [Bacteroidaceae bacterium]|nr:ABC transporter permease [Bacteroidaceae bacterium]